VTPESPLVSVGLPVRNAAGSIREVVRSVLAQDHENLELIISDNASTDDTEAVCRGLAGDDSRVVYCRQPQNIGLLPNFVFALNQSRGDFFRWIGDDDWLAPDYVSRCLKALGERPDAVLATTLIQYVGLDPGASQAALYDPGPLASSDPVDRIGAMLTALNAHHFVVDPLYALLRRDAVVRIPRRNMYQEDQHYAVQLALAGPWVHVPALLAGRSVGVPRATLAAERLGFPKWQLRVGTSLLCREFLRDVDEIELAAAQRRRAYAEIARFYGGRQAHIATNRARRIGRLVGRGIEEARRRIRRP
jgi:glycosyltransferase involved in cell wall biosynthesis